MNSEKKIASFPAGVASVVPIKSPQILGKSQKIAVQHEVQSDDMGKHAIVNH